MIVVAKGSPRIVRNCSRNAEKCISKKQVGMRIIAVWDSRRLSAAAKTDVCIAAAGTVQGSFSAKRRRLRMTRAGVRTYGAVLSRALTIQITPGDRMHRGAKTKTGWPATRVLPHAGSDETS